MFFVLEDKDSITFILFSFSRTNKHYVYNVFMLEDKNSITFILFSCSRTNKHYVYNVFVLEDKNKYCVSAEPTLHDRSMDTERFASANILALLKAPNQQPICYLHMQQEYRATLGEQHNL